MNPAGRQELSVLRSRGAADARRGDEQRGAVVGDHEIAERGAHVQGVALEDLLVQESRHLADVLDADLPVRPVGAAGERVLTNLVGAVGEQDLDRDVLSGME